MPLARFSARARGPLLLALSTGLLLGACQLARTASVPALGPLTTATPRPATIVPTPAPTPAPAATRPPGDTGWIPLTPGLEQRMLHVFEAERTVEQIVALRLEPNRFRLDVGYAPGQPQSLAAWAAESGAPIVINAGFFTPAFEATGLIVTEGKASGVSYGEFAGMLAIVDGSAELRWLAEQPYDPTERLEAAIQSFPLLIRPKDPDPHPVEDDVPARRTVLAQDAAGRLLFIIAGWGHFSLHALSHFLLASDLELTIALNLDGGASSGLYLDPTIAADAPSPGVPALTPLPAVLLAYPRPPLPTKQPAN